MKSTQRGTASGEDLEDFESADEPLSDYLPSFLWVVRDFALQLVDEEGTPLSSQEYLERALTEKGPSDDPKNQVRRALKRYFKERQCQTMIRPLTNEDELQNLDKRDLRELRSEFVEQVKLLRERVLQNVKVKTIKGHQMNGSEWMTLVELYVEAINTGAVPSIQSAWTYLCRQGADQALETAKAQFEKDLAQFVAHLPMNQEDLEAFLRDQT